SNISNSSATTTSRSIYRDFAPEAGTRPLLIRKSPSDRLRALPRLHSLRPDIEYEGVLALKIIHPHSDGQIESIKVPHQADDRAIIAMLSNIIAVGEVQVIF